MNRPVSFKPHQRLAALMRRPGGITAEEALKRATLRVEGARERCMAGLDAKIEEIAAAFADSECASMQAIYSAATEIYSLAGTFGLKELAEAAASLCDLLVAFQRDDPKQGLGAASRVSAVRVHVDALRTLRQPDLSGDARARAAVVEGLKRVSEKGKVGQGG